jgi:hypothetical protein
MNMVWNPFEFVTQSDNDYSSIFSESEISSEPLTSRSSNIVVEVEIGKSAIVELLVKRNRKKSNSEKVEIKSTLVEI